MPGRPPITAWHVLTHTTGLGDVDLEQLCSRAATAPNSSAARWPCRRKRRPGRGSGT